jgi:hypothetical protein
VLLCADVLTEGAFCIPHTTTMTMGSSNTIFRLSRNCDRNITFSICCGGSFNEHATRSGLNLSRNVDRYLPTMGGQTTVIKREVARRTHSTLVIPVVFVVVSLWVWMCLFLLCEEFSCPVTNGVLPKLDPM